MTKRCWLALIGAVLMAVGPLHAQTSPARPAAVAASAPRPASPWTALADDGLHDPRNPAIGLLQQPAEALAALPRDTAGNQVRWVQALDQGVIQPRANLSASTPVRVRDQDLIISKYGSMPAVLFPHRQHTLWLDCANCHDRLFPQKAGATRFSMQRILDGEQCGVCHGAVSFPLTECNRCHSVPNDSLRGRPDVGPVKPLAGGSP
ncbi:c(7)-type cytochrome triheme domain-containing protein [Leptothrix sp. BB-4]